MRAVIQRVTKASVKVEGKDIASINKGLLILLGVGSLDTIEDIEWLSKKIIQLRVFSNESGNMNRSVQDIEGDIIVVSQFTLYASTKKGNRPSFMNSAKPELANSLYENFVEKLEKQHSKKIQTGIFGADMEVSSVNDGPITIIIDTKNKE